MCALVQARDCAEWLLRLGEETDNSQLRLAVYGNEPVGVVQYVLLSVKSVIQSGALSVSTNST